MRVLRWWLHSLDDVPPLLRGAIGALAVLVAVLWPILLLPEGTHSAVHAVLSVVSIVVLFALAGFLVRRFYPGVRHREG